jgi:hypothetical protein
MADDLPHETFDATDLAAEANAKRDAARRERADLDVLRNLMRDKKGRDWLYRFLDSCHINNTPFAPGQPDVTAFHLGEENVGKRVLLLAMTASTDLYMKMITEQQEEEKRLAEVRRKERQNREERDGPINVQGLVADLPPPAGYPGGPPLPKKDKKP